MLVNVRGALKTGVCFLFFAIWSFNGSGAGVRTALSTRCAELQTSTLAGCIARGQTTDVIGSRAWGRWRLHSVHGRHAFQNRCKDRGVSTHSIVSGVAICDCGDAGKRRRLGGMRPCKGAANKRDVGRVRWAFAVFVVAAPQAVTA